MELMISAAVTGARMPGTLKEPATAPEVRASADRPSVVLRPGLFERLSAGRRVTRVSAPAGSGKTVLLRSWIAGSDLTRSTAWVSVAREEQDQQRFWLSVLDALRSTDAGSARMRPVTAAPDLDGWSIVDRLIADLGAVEEPLWLVIDDLHELAAPDALAQLESLVTRAPAQLRFVLLTRVDVRLGLHRLRLEGELTEIRGADLRFTVQESLTLFETAGVRLSEGALGALVARTEGWAAGLRLAVLSLAGHADAEHFAVDFSGSERTVSEYLLAEVLDRLPAEVACLVLRTSMLERVSGALADRLTGASDSHRILAELEEAGAFVVALDAQRSWFRYHRLFADLLALELQRTAPGELPGLHTTAAEWFSEHGYPVEAIRHAQAGGNWPLAARLLADHWHGIYLDGKWATAHELLAAFSAEAVAADPELMLVAAADEHTRGSPEEAERRLTRATRQSGGVAEERRARFDLAHATLRLTFGRARNDVAAVAQATEELLLAAESPERVPSGLGEDLRALALTQLGMAEIWSGRHEEAEQHLEQALALAGRIDRPLLELDALAHLALVSAYRDPSLGEERSSQALELAQANGWSERRFVRVAYAVLANVNLWRGRLSEAEHWLQRATQVLPGDVEAAPAAGLMLHNHRALLELARGRQEEALAALRAAQRHDTLIGHSPLPFVRDHMLLIQVQTGDTASVERALAELDGEARDTLHRRVVLAALHLAQDRPEDATAALGPVLDDPAAPLLPARSATVITLRWAIYALLLGAIALDAVRDPGGAFRALERALDLAEPDGELLAFLLFPAPELLERHARLRTAHASLVLEILGLLAGRTPTARSAPPDPLPEPLSDSELRVLRYLPTNLPAAEIASELFVSINTIRTHMRHLYAKLDVHTRAQAVERARGLGLLASTPRRR